MTGMSLSNCPAKQSQRLLVLKIAGTLLLIMPQTGSFIALSARIASA